MTHVVTSKAKAFLSEYSPIGPEELGKLTDASRLLFSTTDMTKSGWTYVGEAEISVTVVDTETLVANKVEALRNQVQSIRANAAVEASRLEDQIQQLLAITYMPTEAA